MLLQVHSNIISNDVISPKPVLMSQQFNLKPWLNLSQHFNPTYRNIVGHAAIVWFSVFNMSQQVATALPNAHNMSNPTMLRYVLLKCCYRKNISIQSRKENEIQLPSRPVYFSFQLPSLRACLHGEGVPRLTGLPG